MTEQAHRVCPWWMGYSLLMPWRRWIWGQDPLHIVGPYIREGITMLEPGPGMGYFTLEAARLAGPTGRVVAVDIQSPMLDRLRRRAKEAGLADVIETRLAKSDRELGIEDLKGQVDFILAFNMVHETADPDLFFAELSGAAKPGCRLLIAEPPLHVSQRTFEANLESARTLGFRTAAGFPIPHSRWALLVKEGPP